MNQFTMATRLSQYEDGLLFEDEILALFQALVDTGLAWTLQGSYGRTAKALLEAGLIKPKEVTT
jgi:hypothetical protein